MQNDCLSKLNNRDLNVSKAIPLYLTPDHQVYWVGTLTKGEEIECNSYLIVDRGEGYLLEAGGYDRFSPTLEKVNSVSSAQSLTHLLFSHQDPDVCASITGWLEFNPSLIVVCPSLWRRFMPHYMAYNVNYKAMSDDGLNLPLKSGGQLKCLSAPYLHSPGNMVVFDSVSGFLFTGDIGAAPYSDEAVHLVIDDWKTQVATMQGFHQRYMSSNRAVSAFIRSIAGLPITAILPQHGAIFRGEEVQKFLQWLGSLPCGVDYLFPTA
ncbi:MAG: MBL fold metallo-hydrolase [Nitrospiraceae bacterium]